jgi:hypothetical protein
MLRALVKARLAIAYPSYHIWVQAATGKDHTQIIPRGGCGSSRTCVILRLIENNALRTAEPIRMKEQNRVQVRVQGWIANRWVSWFEGMTVAYEGVEDNSPTTLLTGPVADQAALRGLLNKIWDLNLSLISVTWTEATTA